MLQGLAQSTYVALFIISEWVDDAEQVLAPTPLGLTLKGTT